MYNHKAAAETIEIFAKALGVEADEVHTSWAETGIMSSHFDMGELHGSLSIASDFTPSFIRVSVWRKDGNHEDIVRVTAPAAIALATVNMAIAQHQLDTASE